MLLPLPILPPPLLPWHSLRTLRLPMPLPPRLRRWLLPPSEAPRGGGRARREEVGQIPHVVLVASVVRLHGVRCGGRRRGAEGDRPSEPPAICPVVWMHLIQHQSVCCQMDCRL